MEEKQFKELLIFQSEIYTTWVTRQALTSLKIIMNEHNKIGIIHEATKWNNEGTNTIPSDHSLAIHLPRHFSHAGLPDRGEQKIS